MNSDQICPLLAALLLAVPLKFVVRPFQANQETVDSSLRQLTAQQVVLPSKYEGFYLFC